MTPIISAADSFANGSGFTACAGAWVFVVTAGMPPMERVFRSLKTECIPAMGYMMAQEDQRDIRSLSDASLQLD
jgi:hypothetical protein